MKDAKKAAQITLLVKEIAGLTEPDPIVLKAQVHQIALQQENPTQILSDTIAGMQPAQAAGIIKSMMTTNSFTTIELLKNINTNTRASDFNGNPKNGCKYGGGNCRKLKQVNCSQEGEPS